MLHAGDVFAVKLPDGRYGAIRVLRTVGKSTLVYTSQYLDHDVPSLNDPLLRKAVRQRRFSFSGTAAIDWLGGNPPKHLEFIGCIPPTKTEAKKQCNCFGYWGDDSGHEAFMEWRWVNDRAAFEEEVRRKQDERARQRRRPQKPKRMCSEDAFWSIIDSLDWKHEGKDGKVLEPAIKLLATKSKLEICHFEERLAYFLYLLDSKVHASNIGEYSFDAKANYVSADAFLYARCAAVANGRAYYESALKKPAKMPKDREFESLLGLARTAYELKTGDELEYETGFSYETFSNAVAWQ